MTVYLDHNATTPLRPEVRELYVELLTEAAANPSSLHAPGRRARQVLDEARERVAGAWGVLEDEILFVSSGTVANNLAWWGVCEQADPAAALVTSAIEHSAILEPARAWERRGRSLFVLPVDTTGNVQWQAISDLRMEIAFVSLQAANNEVGSTVDLAAVRDLLEERPQRVFLHTDSVQALGRLPLALEHVDLASFSAHKVGGPLGVGVLYRKQGTPLAPLTHGGGHEQAFWPGTENVPAIGAAALAIELAVHERETYARRTSQLAQRLWRGLQEALPNVRCLGPDIDDATRLPNTLNVTLPGLDGRVLVTRLDLAGLAVSAGSACASGSLEPSHVLTAMGLSEEEARAGLRLSLGRDTSEEDIHNAVDIMRKTLV